MPVWVSWLNVSPRQDGFPSGYPSSGRHSIRIPTLAWHICILYARCSFSVAIGQVMVTRPPYKIDIGVQYRFPTIRLGAVRFMCSTFNLNSWKGTQQKWIDTRNSGEFGTLVKLWIVMDPCRNTNYTCIIFIEDKTHFQIKLINH